MSITHGALFVYGSTNTLLARLHETSKDVLVHRHLAYLNALSCRVIPLPCLFDMYFANLRSSSTSSSDSTVL